MRTPKLCDLYHKTERKKLTEKEIAQANREAILNLRQEKVSEQNYPTFINELVGTVH